jgi:F-type H+-transporting ATPase subunit beta
MEMINNVSRTGAGMAFFAGIGERIREGHELYQTLGESRPAQEHLHVLRTDGPEPGAASLIARVAVTLAEYFRDEQGRTSCSSPTTCTAIFRPRTRSRPCLDQIPAKVVMSRPSFSDVKVLQDRLTSNENGSITAVQTIYVPADDLTSDPAVQMIQHELDSIIVLSRKVAEQGIRPAVDLLKTTSSC